EPSVYESAGCQVAARLASRRSSMVMATGGTSAVGVGPPSSASSARREMAPVTLIVGANGTPVVAVLGQGLRGDTLVPTMLAAGVTVTWESTATAGLACGLVGVSAVLTVDPI